MVTSASSVCGVCSNSATVVDWMPVQGWLTVEGCPCGGFFIWRALWDWRLSGMVKTECEELASRIREWRSSGREAWIATRDGTLMGPLVVFPERPVIAA
jgi:hypothetical protein